MNKLIKYYLDNTSKIYGYTLKLYKYDREKTDHLIGDMLLKVLEKNIGYNELRASETTILCTIIKNMFLDNIRRKSEKFNKVELFECYNSVNCEIGMDVPIIEKQIDKLKNRHKLVIDLHIKGYSYNEISESLNIPVGTVKADMFKIRGLLKKRLSEVGFEINY
jgi:RNA polymerase sigma-70 factor (ECF subfamily)